MAKSDKDWGSEIKGVGILLIVVGAVMLGLVLLLLIIGDTSPLGYLINKHFFFLVVGGLVCLLAGIITRSIGKSKQNKK